MFIEKRVPPSPLQSRRDTMFIVYVFGLYLQSRRDEMFIEQRVPPPLFSPVGTLCL